MAVNLRRALQEMPEVDLANLVEARELMSSSALAHERAESRYGSQVAVEDRVLETNRGAIKARVYFPTSSESTELAILLIHGGAFVGGDLGSEHARCLRYAAEVGCVVVSPDYGLAPEFPYPSALEDCYAVLEWMQSDPENLGVAKGSTVLVGVSAGGSLAAGLGLLARDRRGPAVKAQMLLCPVLDDRMESNSMRRFVDTPVWNSANNRKMWDLYLSGSEADKYAAPARAEDLAGSPKTYLLVAEHDPLRDEGLEFANRLLAASICLDLRMWAGSYHVFDQLLPDAELSDWSLSDQVHFLRRLVE